MQFCGVRDFEDWRNVARQAVVHSCSPEELQFTDLRSSPSLFGPAADPFQSAVAPHSMTSLPRVPPRFLELARMVACHRDPHRFNLLYRILWRLVHKEPHILEAVTDDDVHCLMLLEKEVRRDVHKMKAFVRFRRLLRDGQEQFVAWHRPDHYIVKLAAPFFARRFPTMNWTILTPDDSVMWDQKALTFGPGVPRSEAPEADALEELWKVYYANIFNPARLNLNMMTKEMPRRHWKTLPETQLIPDLIQQAPTRVRTMINHQEGSNRSAADYLPDRISYRGLAAAAEHCKGCDLYLGATQTVFGEGPVSARLVLVGEQPGDQEDQEGKPFVGPAGKVLDRILEEVGIERSKVYLTNAVKHFKFTATGTRRLHAKPSAREVTACRPWLTSELSLTEPEVLVCLGATAAQTILGRSFRLTQQRGQIVSTEFCPQTIATYHPSAVLRMPDKARRDDLEKKLIEDLSTAVKLLSAE